MGKTKRIYLKTIRWATHFESVRGSYYDYVAEIHSPYEAKEQEIFKELIFKGWLKVETSDSLLTVFRKDRYIIRIFRVWR